MTAVLTVLGAWCCVSVLSVVAWALLKRDARRQARIEAERRAANCRTWAHIVGSREADWAAWELEVAER